MILNKKIEGVNNSKTNNKQLPMTGGNVGNNKNLEFRLNSENNNPNTIGNNLNTGNPIKKFIQFVEKKNNIGYINPKIMKIIKKKFIDIDTESAPVCQYADENHNITIDINDEAIQTFVENYKDMKRDYLTTCDDLLNILETQILKPSDDSKDTTTSPLSLNTINFKDLIVLETDVRTLLKNMYINCHKSYLTGIKLLETYFLTPKKTIEMNTSNSNTNNNVKVGGGISKSGGKTKKQKNKSKSK